MKKYLLILIIVPAFCKAQMHIVKDTLFLNDSIKLVKGQYLNFGIGSNIATKGFNFISTKPSILMTEVIYLPGSWMKKKMIITKFKVFKSKKTGDTYYVILDGGNLVNYMCDIAPAIETKEVIL
jgi:hypothetical protein